MKGHILILADGRSPTALSWIKNIHSLGYRVSLVSTFPCDQPHEVEQFHILPIAFSRLSTGSKTSPTKTSDSKLKTLVRRLTPLLQNFRYILGPLSLLLYTHRYQKLVKRISPDIVHALRIPFEGMLGAYTPEGFPFLAAIWGNDLTLHADKSLLMRHFTRRCLSRANGLTADTHRDLRLARNWGLKQTAPTLTVPGSGGLDLAALDNVGEFDNRFGIPEAAAWVVNPRGLRPGSVHQEVFFEAIPKVLQVNRDICFICPGLKGHPQAQAWISQFNITERTYLLPKLSQQQLWALFKKSALYVSPSSHDGTPNTLLEAMACGCLPVVGDIESLREWITHEKNGILANPQDAKALANAILAAVNQVDLRQEARKINRDIIESRADVKVTLPKIDAFYKGFTS